MRIISNKNIYFSERKERQCPPFSHSEWIKFAIFALIVRPKKKKLQMSKHITEEQRYAIFYDVANTDEQKSGIVRKSV